MLTGRVVSFGGGRGHAGKGGARRGLGHDGEWRERVVGIAAGGRTRLYTWPRVGLADEASSDAISGR